MPVVWTIVVAGGSGQRFGQMKQFASLAGRPVVAHAIAASRPWSAGVVLVVPAGAESRGKHGADIVVDGGATRSESVRHGLARVPAEAEIIVVHDAARPLASAKLFHSVIDALNAEDVAAAVPGVPVSDTIKQMDEAHNVTATPDRSTLVAVQTPQAFQAHVIRQAHEAGTVATDDAALVEQLGATVRVVPGEARNIKITTREDLVTAERLMTAGE